jgi:cytochrome c-type biogenesis protein CcmE
MKLRAAILLALIAGSLAWVATRGLSGSLVYFVTPTELVTRQAPAGERLRLGGLVVPGSVHREDGEIRFVVTDETTRVTVVHRGGTPALFRSGIGVVLEGTYRSDGLFHSDTMLIKHSEEYRPPAEGEKPTTTLG